MKYQKKQSAFEAIQWDETQETLNKLQKMGFVWSGHTGHQAHPNLVQNLRMRIPEGTRRVYKGDWLVQQADGGFLPYSEDGFRLIYEPALTPAPPSARNGTEGTEDAFRFRPAPGHYTRENWLAYRVIAQLSESGLDVNTSPAVKVWDVAHREIMAWMNEHGIKTGLPTGARDNEQPDAARRATPETK